MPMTRTEQETIGLCIATEALRGMANHSLLQVMRRDDAPDEAEVRFQTREHLQLFLARLLDFVKEVGDATLTGVTGSCLDVLRAACATRAFDVNGSVGPLQRAVEGFDSWLLSETPLRLWLPTLDIEADLKLQRQELLFISGNQSKHNLSRLTRVAKRIAGILKDHGYTVPIELIPLALEDFQQHLQEGYFVYYCTWIAEHLTKLHWGVQNYLLPAYRVAYQPPAEGEHSYSYTFPSDITDSVAREWFWRLMNHVRSGPYLQPLVAPYYLKDEAILGGG